MRPVGLEAALVACACAAAAAQQQVQVCSLLTHAELQAAVGAPVGAQHQSDMVIPEGPAKGQTMAGCMWPVEGQGMVAVSVARLPAGAQVASGLAALNKAFDEARARGWQEAERQDSKGTRCALLVPPASLASAPNMTGCLSEAKGRGISVVFLSPTKKLPVAGVRTLLGQAIARLR